MSCIKTRPIHGMARSYCAVVTNTVLPSINTSVRVCRRSLSEVHQDKTITVLKMMDNCLVLIP